MAILTSNRPAAARPHPGGESASSPSPLVDLVLVRVACAGGATRAETIRDLGQMVAHRLSPGEWRQAAEDALAALIGDGSAVEKRGRYEATDAGHTRAALYLVLRQPAKLGPWAEVRDAQLIARALGLEAESTPKLKALGTPEGLRALIVQKAFGLTRRIRTSPAKLRAELAIVALERAFGNKLKTSLGSGGGLSAKAGRMLAAQLSRRPRDYGTDSKLIAALAAEHVDAAQPSLDVLRTAILKRFVNETLAPAPVAATTPSADSAVAAVPAAAASRSPASVPVVSPRRAAPVADNDAAPAAPPLPMLRPDLDTFAAEVVRLAAPAAEGWSGNRKAFISHVWPAIRDSRPEWGLSEIEFKCMLVEAHRAGRLALSSADLKNKNNIKDIQESAISWMNTVWHYVRIED